MGTRWAWNLTAPSNLCQVGGVDDVLGSTGEGISSMTCLKTQELLPFLQQDNHNRNKNNVQNLLNT